MISTEGDKITTENAFTMCLEWTIRLKWSQLSSKNMRLKGKILKMIEMRGGKWWKSIYRVLSGRWMKRWQLTTTTYETSPNTWEWKHHHHQLVVVDSTVVVVDFPSVSFFIRQKILYMMRISWISNIKVMRNREWVKIWKSDAHHKQVVFCWVICSVVSLFHHLTEIRKNDEKLKFIREEKCFNDTKHIF